MEALLKKTGHKLHGFKTGQEVEGEIVSLSPKEILIDIGGKTAGTVARRELPFLKDLIPDFKVGEKVRVKVLLPEGQSGRPLLSFKDFASQKSWQDLEEKEKNKEEVEILVRKPIHGGVLVDYRNLTGFVPQSQLDPKVADKPEKLLGQKIKAKVLEAKRSQNRLVLSQKLVTQKKQIKKLRKLAKKIKPGQTVEAEVVSIVPFGLFVKTEKDLEGLVHISEIAWEKVDNPEEYYQVGDKIEAEVLDFDEDSLRLNLSIKNLSEDPWEKISKKYKKEQIVKGKVTRVSSYGVFVELEKGVEGLLHISKIPADKEFKKGDKIECVIEKIDPEGRKISLSFLPTKKPVGYR